MRLSLQNPRRTRCAIDAEAARHYRAAPVRTRGGQAYAREYGTWINDQCRKYALMVSVDTIRAYFRHRSLLPRESAACTIGV